MALQFTPFVTIEEAALAGGVGSAILETLADEELQVPVRRIGLPDRFIEHGSRSDLLASVGLEASQITRHIVEFLGDSIHQRAETRS
jgi:1-deoxy-D-xylulose-5-phosphate synthase